MTNHPITPPPELLDQWCMENNLRDIAIQAAQWGADACCEWIPKRTSWDAERLRTARRPKPASLKEQAMAQLQTVEEVLNYYTSGCIVDTIRRALESLDD